MLLDFELDTGTALAGAGIFFVLFVIAISFWYWRFQFKAQFGCYDCGWRGNRERLEPFALCDETPKALEAIAHLSHVAHLVTIAAKETSTRYTCPYCRGGGVEQITYKSRQLPPPPPVPSNAKAKEFLRNASKSARK